MAHACKRWMFFKEISEPFFIPGVNGQNRLPEQISKLFVHKLAMPPS
jgi:hypothetical protein